MLYIVSCYANARERKIVPLLVRIEDGKSPIITDTSARDLDKPPIEFELAGMGTGLMGEMVYDPEDDNSAPSARRGYFGVPLWLSSSSALKTSTPDGVHPEKVWLVSKRMGKGSVYVVGEKHFPCRSTKSKVPAAVYAASMFKALMERAQISVEDNPIGHALREIHASDKDMFRKLVEFGMTIESFQDQHRDGTCREGLNLIFIDKSRIVIARDEPVQVDLSFMDFGMDKRRFVPMPEESYRN